MTRPTHRKTRRNTPTAQPANDHLTFAPFEELESKLLMSTYYVATNGSDSAAGTLTTPFASLKKFFTVARPGDTLYVRGGSYDGSQSAWQSIAPRVSGTASAPITVTNMPGEKVIIDHKSPSSGTFLSLANAESYLVFQGLTVKNYLVGFNMQGGTPNHITLDNLDLRNFSVVGSSGGRAIRMRGVDNITISNTNIQDVGGVGIAGIGSVRNTLIDGLTIHNINDGRGAAGDGDGINMTYGDNTWADYVTIRNTRTWDTSEDGIDLKGDHMTFENDIVTRAGADGIKAWSVWAGGAYVRQAHVTVRNCVAFDVGQVAFEAFSLPVLTMENSTFVNDGEQTVLYKAPYDTEPWKGSVSIRNTNMEHSGGGTALGINKNGNTLFDLQGNTYYSSGSSAVSVYTSSGTKSYSGAAMANGTFTAAQGTETAGSGANTNVAPVVMDADGTQPLAAGQQGSFAGVAYDPDGTSVSYRWTFGDGSTATGASATHAYSGNGAYAASLSVTDSGGAIGSRGLNMVVGNSGSVPTNTAPVAQDQTLSGTQNSAIVGTARATDANNDPLQYALSTQAAHGIATLGSSGQFTYTPAANWYGQDSFVFGVSDGRGGSDTGRITLNVQPPVTTDRPPVAANDSASAKDTQPVIINVLANDSDPDGDLLAVTSTTRPARGTVTINANGSLTYTPTAPYSGTDAFQYTVSDGKGGTDSATVTVALSQTQVSTGSYTATDIGDPVVGGSTSYNAAAGTYTVSGAGVNIWGTADEFQYAYRTMTGDGQIVARIDAMTSPHHFAKAGLMMRDTLAANSAQVMATLTGSEGTGIYYRTTAGSSSANSLVGDTAQRAPMWLKLVRQGSTFTSFKSTDGTTWTQTGTATVAMGQTIYVGMAVGSHDDTAAATATFSNVALGAQSNPTPTVDLQARDIGAPALTGTTQAPSTDTYSVSGAGANIWNAADQFQYASQSLTGDGTIIAQIDAMDYTHHFAKAGLMIRDTLDANSKHVMVTLTGSEGTGMYYRSTTGGTSANILAGDVGLTGPVWLKLVRSGDTFTGFKSADGVNWITLGTTTVAMNQTVQVGLAVGSHDVGSLASAQFDNVEIVD